MMGMMGSMGKKGRMGTKGRIGIMRKMGRMEEWVTFAGWVQRGVWVWAGEWVQREWMGTMGGVFMAIKCLWLSTDYGHEHMKYPPSTLVKEAKN